MQFTRVKHLFLMITKLYGELAILSHYFRVASATFWLEIFFVLSLYEVYVRFGSIYYLFSYILETIRNVCSYFDNNRLKDLRIMWTLFLKFLKIKRVLC